MRKRAGSGRRRRTGWAGIGLVLVGVVMAFGSLPAAAAPSGSVSGVVRDPGGNPVEGICVTAADGPGTRTDAAGAYTIGALETGTYTLSYVDCNATPQYVDQWYQGHREKGDADPVAVTDGTDTPLGDVTLELGVSIHGAVTGGGNGLSGMTVAVNPTSPGLPSVVVATDANGDYATSPLPPGDYTVKFSDPASTPAWDTQWWKQATTEGAANPVTLALSDGNVHGGIDAPMTAHTVADATIEGTVRGPGGAGLVSICVSVQAPRNGGGFDWVAGSNTIADGTYRIEHVPPGDYRIQFRDCNNGPYMDQWYDGRTDGDQSTPVQLTAGAVRSGVDATLMRGVVVSGRVVDPQGQAIQGINVNVNPVDSGPSGWAQTDADGRYRSTGLPLGSYLVSFQDQSPTPVWASQYWDGAASRNAATTLTLTAADRPVRDGVDATLQAAASVAGHVSAPGGGPAANICVNAIVPSGDNPDWVGGTSTAPDGSYRLGGLPATAVRIMFQDCNGTGPYVTQWWRGAATFDDATPVVLHPGTNRTGVDARLAPAGAITGTVTDRAGHPLEGICVQASATSFVGGFARTQSDGSYSLLLSRPGRFRVQFVDCTGTPRFAGQWWHDGATVTVAAGQTVGQVDASLLRGQVASVSGRVVNVNGHAMTTACVVVYMPNQYALFAPVNADGTFTVPNVPSGTYAIAFLGCAANQEPSATVHDPQSPTTSYPAVWWGGHVVSIANGEGGPDPIAQDAKLVAVTPGARLSGFDQCFGCGALTITSITPGHGSLTIAFTSSLVAPEGMSTAAAASTAYTASCISTTRGAPGSASGNASPITVTGLTPGATYACEVRAANGGIVVAASSGTSTAVVLAEQTTDPATGGSASPTASDSGSSMARTGANSAFQAGAGAALVLLGGGLVLGSRARRRTLVAGHPRS